MAERERECKWATVCVSLCSAPSVPAPCAVSLLSAANTATCTQADNVKYHSRMAMEAGEQIHGTTKDISEPNDAKGTADQKDMRNAKNETETESSSS